MREQMRHSIDRARGLLEWLRQGHSLNEKVNATPLQYNQSQFTSCKGKLSGVYKFSNSESNQNYPQTVLSATANSVNSAYIAMGLQLNLCNIVNGAADLGVLRAGNPNTKDNAGQPYGNVPFGAYPGNNPPAAVQRHGGKGLNFVFVDGHGEFLASQTGPTLDYTKGWW